MSWFIFTIFLTSVTHVAFIFKLFFLFSTLRTLYVSLIFYVACDGPQSILVFSWESVFIISLVAVVLQVLTTEKKIIK